MRRFIGVLLASHVGWLLGLVLDLPKVLWPCLVIWTLAGLLGTSYAMKNT